MRFKNGMMISAALCCISSGAADEPTGNVAADITEDLKEAGAGVITFLDAEYELVKQGIATEATLIQGSVTSATDWLKVKAAQLSADAQTGLAAVIKQAQAEATNPAELVSSVLGIIYNDAQSVALGIAPEVVTELKAVESSVIAGIAGVTTLASTL